MSERAENMPERQTAWHKGEIAYFFDGFGTLVDSVLDSRPEYISEQPDEIHLAIPVLVDVDHRNSKPLTTHGSRVMHITGHPSGYDGLSVWRFELRDKKESPELPIYFQDSMLIKTTDDAGRELIGFYAKESEDLPYNSKLPIREDVNSIATLLDINYQYLEEGFPVRAKNAISYLEREDDVGMEFDEETLEQLKKLDFLTATLIDVSSVNDFDSNLIANNRSVLMNYYFIDSRDRLIRRDGYQVLIEHNLNPSMSERSMKIQVIDTESVSPEAEPWAQHSVAALEVIFEDGSNEPYDYYETRVNKLGVNFAELIRAQSMRLQRYVAPDKQ